MSAEENKALVRRMYDEMWNTGRLDVADEIIASDFTDHSPNAGMPANRDGIKQSVMMYRGAFPDTHFTVDELLADGDRVIVRWMAEGTHQATLGGIPATGKHARVSGIDIIRVANGKIVEHWGAWDQLSLMQQLGAIPAPEQASQVGA